MFKLTQILKILRWVWIVGGLLVIVGLIFSYNANGVNKEVLTSSSAVIVNETNNFISFTPTTTFKKVLLFYPGALVQAKAYAPQCRSIADSGIKVLLIKMPWRLASQGYNKPLQLHLLDDTSKIYILAGHSQGGKMAAQFVFEHPGLINGLVLIGTTHPRDVDLSTSGIPMMKIYGSNDGVASMYDINLNKPKLPASTKYQLIEGANHVQFGYYLFQLGDHKAAISRSRQQELTASYLLDFIVKVKK